MGYKILIISCLVFYIAPLSSAHPSRHHDNGPAPTLKNIFIRMPQSTSATNVDCSSKDFQFTGRCNHMSHRVQGSSHTPFLLIAKPAKTDPQSVDLPSARLVSNLVSHEDKSPPNKRRLNELFTFFGQLLDHMVAETHASNVSMNIPIPADDKFFAPGGTIPFRRSVRMNAPRGLSPENVISSYVDGSVVYGSSRKVADALRSHTGGMMQTSSGNLLPMNNRMHFRAGDVRANENPALQSMHTLFVREHNRVCQELHKSFPSWDDNRYFDLTRRIVVAEMQQIIFNEFVPAMLGRKLPKYSGYKGYVDSSISNEFATVAFRVGHTLINPELIVKYDKHGKPVREPLRNLFFHTTHVVEHGIDGILRGIMTTTAAEVDSRVTSELRNALRLDDAFKTDLVALNIQRGRDHHIPPYNALRKLFGLRPRRKFSEITKDEKVAKTLSAVYLGDIDRVDPWIGGTAEDHYGKGSLGELFTAIWVSEFTRMREGNRFYYENTPFWGNFSGKKIQGLKTMKLLNKEKKSGGTLRRILKLNTKIPFHAYPKLSKLKHKDSYESVFFNK